MLQKKIFSKNHDDTFRPRTICMETVQTQIWRIVKLSHCAVNNDFSSHLQACHDVCKYLIAKWWMKISISGDKTFRESAFLSYLIVMLRLEFGQNLWKVFFLSLFLWIQFSGNSISFTAYFKFSSLNKSNTQYQKHEELYPKPNTTRF